MISQRPTVQVRGENQAQALRAHLDQTLPQLQALPGVVGVTLNGGLSRGYADQLSEIDVTLYLDAPTFAAWEQGRAPLGTGIVMLDGQLYDIKFVNLETESARQWESMELWDLSYAEILFDPTGAVALLFVDKLAPPQPSAAGGLMFSAWWYFRLAGDIWLQRGDVLQGQVMLNHAVEALVKALFLANGEYQPHEKWLIHLSRSLAWKPPDWETRLARCLLAVDETEAGLRQRQAEIVRLWDEIDRHIIEQHCPDLPVRLMQKYFYDLLAWLVERRRLTVAEWQERAGLALLNTAPFYLIVRREGECLVLDAERLAQIQPEDLYRWHFEVLAAVRTLAGNLR
ncbi:MAG TPA: DUF4037 domain-containing protein [Phototrophicaceae bacterium]|nr:DUF4037 domain-containing protein [Phototrophicaceae bacterium]